MRKYLIYIPNIITSIRLIILPIFVLNFHGALMEPLTYNFAPVVYLFIIMLITDWLDGFLARRYSWVTETGKWLDPFADKLVDGCGWVTIIAFLFTNNNVDKMTWQAMVAYWLGFSAVTGLFMFRSWQDIYSQWHYRRYGGQSNIFGKIKFNLDMLGIFLGAISMHILQRRGQDLVSAMSLMGSSLAMAAIFAHRSIQIKRGVQIDQVMTTELPAFDLTALPSDALN